MMCTHPLALEHQVSLRSAAYITTPPRAARECLNLVADPIEAVRSLPTADNRFTQPPRNLCRLCNGYLYSLIYLLLCVYSPYSLLLGVFPSVVVDISLGVIEIC